MSKSRHTVSRSVAAKAIARDPIAPHVTDPVTGAVRPLTRYERKQGERALSRMVHVRAAQIMHDAYVRAVEPQSITL